MDERSVAAELARLQRNRGLQSGDLSGRVGPGLAQLTGFNASRVDARASLTRQLMLASASLPPDLKLVFARACATRPDDRPGLTERLDTVAKYIDRSREVARRRLDDANLLVAGRLLQGRGDDRGWFIDALSVQVDFTDPSPVYKASHTVVVTAPTVSTLTEKISLPGNGRDVGLEFLVSGQAQLGSIRRIHPQTWEVTMTLDRTFSCGEAIEYETAVRLPDRRDAPPMSVMVPMRDCGMFATRVKLAGLATAVWVLDGVTPPTVSDERPTGSLIDPGVEPEPAVEFRNLTPGMAYGLRWTWSEF